MNENEDEEENESLKDDMRNVIEEARMILPGVQALSASRRWQYSIIDLKNLSTRAGLPISPHLDYSRCPWVC